MVTHSRHTDRNKGFQSRSSVAPFSVCWRLPSATALTVTLLLLEGHPNVRQGDGESLGPESPP